MHWGLLLQTIRIHLKITPFSVYTLMRSSFPRFEGTLEAFPGKTCRYDTSQRFLLRTVFTVIKEERSAVARSGLLEGGGGGVAMPFPDKQTLVNVNRLCLLTLDGDYESDVAQCNVMIQLSIGSYFWLYSADTCLLSFLEKLLAQHCSTECCI